MRRTSPSDPSEALLHRTRRRLAIVTLAMVTTLVVAIGVTTAVAASALMRQGIDRTLDHAVEDTLNLHEPFDSEGASSGLGEADTFVLLVTADGRIVASSTDTVLAGLPDRAAIDRAAAGDDRRDGTYGKTPIRLLTTSIEELDLEDDDADVPNGPLFVQAGFNLTLQTRLEQQLLVAIAVVGLLGMVGAVIVTLFITRRALVPIREAFTTERRFVAAASHELQTPAAIIRASAELLEREQLVGPAGSTLVGDIITETDRLGRLVGDLLTLASLQAGALPLHVEELIVEDWFAAVTRRARSMIESQGLRFSTETTGAAGHQGGSATIESDRDRLDQVVLILIDNAAHHSPPAGEVALGLRIDPSAGTATAQIRDEGPGIPSGELDRIFEPFARGASRRRATSGAGLGLAIARQLTRRLGATLSVSSVSGAGATFEVTVPLARGPRRAGSG